jgi:CelD/BcsL family acetyltransferase involved in cellulose biosynthesis
VPLIDATPGFRPLPGRRFTVELFDGGDLEAAGWPLIAAGPELAMHVYQSREFLEVWMASIGKARRARCFLVVVKDNGSNPVLYLPLVIETRFNNRILRFMDFFAPGIHDFYARMAAPEQLGRISNLSALVCGDKVVSAHLGFVGRGRFYYVLPAFDTGYRPYAVGILLLDHLVERCAAERYTTFDLGEGDFAYKSKWATHRLPLLACEQAVTSIGALFGQLRRVRRITGIEQIYDFCANGRAGLAGARARQNIEPPGPSTPNRLKPRPDETRADETRADEQSRGPTPDLPQVNHVMQVRQVNHVNHVP